jgi:POT family proton-dependent oligopeptide transporter
LPPPPLTGTFLDRARGCAGVADSDIADLAAVARLAPVFAVLPVFWSLYDATSATWTLQARRLDLMGAEPDQVYLLNSLLTVLLVPPFDLAVRRLNALPERWAWLRPTPLRRMTLGCVLTSAAFAASGAVQAAADAADAADAASSSGGARPSVLWQVPQFVILSVAELCVSTTGLEFFFREAPASAKGLVLALFFLTTALGNLLNGVVYAAVDGVLSPLQTIWAFTALMLAAAGAFAAVAAAYRPARRAGQGPGAAEGGAADSGAGA